MKNSVKLAKIINYLLGLVTVFAVTFFITAAGVFAVTSWTGPTQSPPDKNLPPPIFDATALTGVQTAEIDISGPLSVAGDATVGTNATIGNSLTVTNAICLEGSATPCITRWEDLVGSGSGLWTEAVGFDYIYNTNRTIPNIEARVYDDGRIQSFVGTDWVQLVGGQGSSKIMWGDDEGDNLNFEFYTEVPIQTFRQVMTLTSAGRVGIGTTDPKASLHLGTIAGVDPRSYNNQPDIFLDSRSTADGISRVEFYGQESSALFGYLNVDNTTILGLENYLGIWGVDDANPGGVGLLIDTEGPDIGWVRLNMRYPVSGAAAPLDIGSGKSLAPNADVVIADLRDDSGVANFPAIEFYDQDGAGGENSGYIGYGTNVGLSLGVIGSVNWPGGDLVIDDSGNIGIGTNFPNSQLHVFSQSSVPSPEPNAEIDLQSVGTAGDGQHWAIYNERTDNSLKFWRNNQNILGLNTSGLVLGNEADRIIEVADGCSGCTTSLGRNLAISAGSAVGTTQPIGGTITLEAGSALVSGGAAIAVEGGSAAGAVKYGGDIFVSAGSISGTNNVSGSVYVSPGTIASGAVSGNVILAHNSIGPRGQVAVGKTTPTQMLDVAGYVKGTGLCINADCRTSWPAAGTAGGWTDGGTNVYLTTLTDNVSIGGTSGPEKLNVVGNLTLSGSNSQIYARTSGGAGSNLTITAGATSDRTTDGGSLILVGGEADEGTSGDVIIAPGAIVSQGIGTYGDIILGYINGEARGSVAIGTANPLGYKLAVNGTAAKPGGGTWLNYSDLRLKDIQGSYNKGLNEILSLNPVEFNYQTNNPLGLPSDETNIGLIAQEVQKVIPEAISENTEGYLMLNSDPVIWAMLNAIKEQQGQIDQLKQEIEDLKK